MSPLLSRGDLGDGDVKVLRELLRYKVMADQQIALRYGDPALAAARLPILKDGGMVFRWRESLEGARIFSPTMLAQHILRQPGLDARKPFSLHLAHDVALVDLADVLLANDPRLEWRTESEIRHYLDQIARPPRRLPGDHPHRPDGLLLRGDERIGVELEHSNKSEQRYIRISRWFVREWRLHRVRWYVDNPRIIERLRQVNAQHGFDRDMEIEIEPFPEGVRVRKRAGLFDP